MGESQRTLDVFCDSLIIKFLEKIDVRKSDIKWTVYTFYLPLEHKMNLENRYENLFLLDVGEIRG